MSDFNDNFDNGSSLQEIASGTDIVKKKKPVALFISGGVLLLAVACVLVYALIPAVRNSVKMAVMKPDNYYASVEKDYIAKQAKKVSEHYGKTIDLYNENDGIASDYEISAEIDPSIASQFGIADLSKIAFKGSYVMTDNNVASTIELLVNDSSIVSLKALMDCANMDTYVKVPELIDAFIKVPMDTIEQDLSSYTDGAVTDTPEIEGKTFNYQDIYNGNLLSEDELEEIINKYYSIIIEDISDVEIDKSEEVDVCGVDCKYNTATVKITEEDAMEIAKDILEELKDDDVIKDACVKLGACTEDEYESGIDDAITSIEDSDSDSSDDNYIELTAYIDANGEICGRKIESFEDKEKSEDFDFFYLAAKDGENIAFDMEMNSDGSNIKVELDGEESSSDTYEGTVNTTISPSDGSSYSFGVDFEDFKIVNEEKGYFNGKFTLDIDQQELAVLNGLTINCESDGSKQDISFDVAVNGTKYGSLKISFADKDPSDITMPSDSDKIYDMSNPEDVEALYQDIDIDSFIQSIKDKTGIDVESLLSSLGIGSNYTDDYTDDYMDDYIDDDYISDGYTEYTTNFNSLDINLNGTSVKVPGVINGASSLLGIDPTTVIGANQSDNLYTEDYSLSMSFLNDTAADLPVDQCKVSSINFYPYQDSAIDFSINGIKVGSTINDIASTFGIDPADSESYITIYSDDDSYNTLTFYMENETVIGLDISVY